MDGVSNLGINDHAETIGIISASNLRFGERPIYGFTGLRSDFLVNRICKHSFSEPPLYFIQHYQAAQRGG